MPKWHGGPHAYTHTYEREIQCGILISSSLFVWSEMNEYKYCLFILFGLQPAKKQSNTTTITHSCIGCYAHCGFYRFLCLLLLHFQAINFFAHFLSSVSSSISLLLHFSFEHWSQMFVEYENTVNDYAHLHIQFYHVCHTCMYVHTK